MHGNELRMTSFGFVLSLFLSSIALFPSNILAEEDSIKLPAEHRMGEGLTWGAESWATAKDDLPQIKNLNVACEKNHMRVFVEFDRPFYGTIFSKGHYSDDQCVHLLPSSGRLSTTFDIFQNACGMTARSGGGKDGTGTGAYIENTIIIQYDPLVQEVWDQARKLRCTWYDYYEKSITFKPFNVDTLQAVTANFLGDNLQCWMQIQMGNGPSASEVSGIVKIGQTMTMVLGIKDDENKFDMLVRNCVAHDGKRQPIQLVDHHGCVVRTKIMDRFQKIRNFGSTASVVSYATFQAFKFPDSMNVYFQCVIQVCRDKCPDPQCENEVGFVDPRIPQKVPVLGSTTHEETLLSDSLSFADFSHLPNDKVQTFPFPGEVNQQRLPPHGVPVPVPIPLVQGFPAVGRVGIAPINDTTTPSTSHPAMVAGPRSFDDVATANAQAQDTVVRQRRSGTTFSSTDSTDVKTVGKIQVVAPGDVAFSLSDANETVVVSRSTFPEKSVICMSMPAFIAGLVLLLLVLSIALIVAAFLMVRLRSQKTQVPYEGYDNPEYVKSGEIMS